MRACAVKNDLACHMPAIKPRLKPRQIQERLNFALEFVDKDMRYSSRALFTYETQVLLHPIDRRRRVRRPRNQRNESKFIVQKSKYGEGSIMFWGSINLRGT